MVLLILQQRAHDEGKKKTRAIKLLSDPIVFFFVNKKIK